MTDKGIKIVKSACRMCHGVCGTLVHIKDGRVIKVTGDPDCPTSKGYICVKGKASPELLYHHDRLKYPLKRVGEKGENKWGRISWDEATETISTTLLKIKEGYGAEAIATRQGTGRPYMLFHQRFARALGTPNMVVTPICYFPRIAASVMTVGQFPVCDFYGFGGAFPRCILVWGCNIMETGASDGMCGNIVRQALKRPGTISIVVDPRRTPAAAMATHHLQLRPGTDGALALAMLNVIINEELYDKEFVSKWTIGFEDLKERVQQYPPEWAEPVTWVSAEEIRAASRTLAAYPPVALQWGNGLDQNVNCFQNSRAVFMLPTLVGSIDVPGGNVFWVPPANIVPQGFESVPGLPFPEIPKEQLSKGLSYGKYRILSPGAHARDFYETVLTGKPYPIKALLVIGTNTFVAEAYSEKVMEAYKKLFVVSIDMFMTPTTQYSDIVLPAASWLETDDVDSRHYVWCVLARQKVAQIGECRDDRQILSDIARKMGMGKYFPFENMREYCDFILKDSGMTFEQFCEKGIITSDRMEYRKYEKGGFKTPSGKVELKSSVTASLGYDPLPFYVEPPESPVSTPEYYKDFPLVMIASAKSQPYFNSEGRQIPSLRKLEPDPQLEIHPQTAQKYGISQNDWVWIENPRGAKIKMKARVTNIVLPGVVAGQHGWWFPEKEPPDYSFRESSTSLLTEGMELDPQTGSESWKSFLVRVSKV